MKKEKIEGKLSLKKEAISKLKSSEIQLKKAGKENTVWTTFCSFPCC